MRYFKVVLKSMLIFLECFAGFLFIYLIVSFYGGILSIGKVKQEGDLHLYVSSNGIHTDISMPVRSDLINWNSFIDGVSFPEATTSEFISISWGDKGFFLDTPTWGDLKTSTALNAAFLPSPTAMHVYYKKEPSESETCVKVFINNSEYQELIEFIKESFLIDNGDVQLIPNKGYTKEDNFYEAKGSYHMFKTCNRWTNVALKKAKIKTGIYALFPDGIISHLKYSP
jgi:uncharacterized protein (TIGR02117 family)